jgi:23S rRNA (guanosine2251-2'-O)-methyltransferase
MPIFVVMFPKKPFHSSPKTGLIIGRQPLLEAFDAGKGIDKILLQKGASGDSIEEIKTVARQYNVPIQSVPPEKLHSLTRANHQCVIAFAALVKYYDLQEVIDSVIVKKQIPLFIILDGVTDVRNIGAIARSAVCCNAQAIIIPDKGVGALNEEAMKASAGALEKIQICRVNSLMKAVDTLHINGIQVFASEMKATKLLHELPLQEPCAIVMGGEEKGVFPALLKICDSSFQIPMPGKFESLNVSVAAGIILYESVKQRMDLV